MLKTKRAGLLALILTLLLLLAACTQAPAQSGSTESPQQPAGTLQEPVAAEAPANPKKHTNKGQFEYVNPEGTVSDINTYYNDLGIECDVNIRGTGGDVAWKKGEEIVLPTPAKKYRVGFSVYYTVDEVGAMYLKGMQDAAAEIGIELLINDADYDQNAQNQAIEQWIVEGVDGVIMTPCDFTGVKGALDSLEAAGIPVVTIDAPPQLGNIDSAVIYDCIEQGRLSGEALEAALLKSGREMKGVIFYGTLPFVHPNAVTREIGFFQVFEKYPDIEIKALTGESPEDHYTAFEGAIQANPDMLGAWGLYSSATYGMMNAIKASGREILLTSVDNDRVILEGIYNGEVLGSACYSAIDGSRLGLVQMINQLEGVDIPGIVYQENIMVTKDNVEKMFEAYYPGQGTLQQYMQGQS